MFNTTNHQGNKNCSHDEMYVAEIPGNLSHSLESKMEGEN